MSIVNQLAIDWLATGAVVILLGGLIKFAGWTWLLAGYSEPISPVSDDIVQDMAGNTMLRVGVVVFVVGVLASVTTLPSYLSAVVGGAILLDVARLIYRLNTWSPSQTGT